MKWHSVTMKDSVGLGTRRRHKNTAGRSVVFVHVCECVYLFIFSKWRPESRQMGVWRWEAEADWWTLRGEGAVRVVWGGSAAGRKWAWKRADLSQEPMICQVAFCLAVAGQYDTVALAFVLSQEDFIIFFLQFWDLSWPGKAGTPAR